MDYSYNRRPWRQAPLSGMAGQHISIHLPLSRAAWGQTERRRRRKCDSQLFPTRTRAFDFYDFLMRLLHGKVSSGHEQIHFSVPMNCDQEQARLSALCAPSGMDHRRFLLFSQQIPWSDFLWLDKLTSLLLRPGGNLRICFILQGIKEDYSYTDKLYLTFNAPLGQTGNISKNMTVHMWKCPCFCVLTVPQTITLQHYFYKTACLCSLVKTNGRILYWMAQNTRPPKGIFYC